MGSTKISFPLEWSHKTTEISEGGLQKIREANSDECKALANSLDLITCVNLKVSYTVEPLGSGAWRVHGELHAILSQSCVISLEPVESVIEESFDIEFRTRSSTEKETPDENDISAAQDIEFMEHDQIDIGRIIYETLSTALNPYPRKEGAKFLWEDPQIKSASPNSSPFLILKKLKPEG